MKPLSLSACAKRQKKKHVSNVKKLSAWKQQRRLREMQKQKQRPKLMLLHAAKPVKRQGPKRQNASASKQRNEQLAKKRKQLLLNAAARKKNSNESQTKKRGALLTKNTDAPSTVRLSQT